MLTGNPVVNRLRDIPVDWDALEDAFENNAPFIHSYMHLVTGDVIRLVDGQTDPAMYTKIQADPNWLKVRPVSSREQFRWMTLFIEDMPSGPRQGVLTSTLDGKGSFRRFKDALNVEERPRWLTFRSERLRNVMDPWLSDLGLSPVERVSGAAPIPARAASMLLDMAPADMIAAFKIVSASRCLACGGVVPCLAHTRATAKRATVPA